MSRLCINCPGHLTGDCADCGENEDPRGGDYEEDALDEEPMDYEPSEQGDEHD